LAAEEEKIFCFFRSNAGGYVKSSCRQAGRRYKIKKRESRSITEGKGMKIEEVKEKLRAQGYLDEREICGYAQFPSIIGGAIGAATNLILLSLYGEMLTAFRSKINNDYKEIVFSVPVAEITDVVVKNGLFGLQKKIKFKAAGVGQKILMAYNEKKMIAFFKELAAAH
jgi:hypothetical protein